MGAAERLPELFTEEQAADYLGVAEVTLRRRRAAGMIGFTRIGRQARYTETHLLNYLEQQTCQPASVSATTGSSNRLVSRVARRLGMQAARFAWHKRS